MSLQDYSLTWTDKLVEQVETHLRDVRSAILQFYEREGYDTGVAVRAAKEADNGEAAGSGELPAHSASSAGDSTEDVVSPGGSFLLRTCVRQVPFPDVHAERGVGADLVVTIPEAKCNAVDLQDGRYLHCRHQFLKEVAGYLRQIAAGAAKKSAGSAAHHHDSDGDEDDAHTSSRQAAVNVAAASRLGRMEVELVNLHGCYANAEKKVIRLRFRRRNARASAPAYETFQVYVHFRPAFHSARVTSAAATRKHPFYSYSILEDYLIPAHLKRLHEMCVASTGLRRAVVILKCWAHHVGLMSAASGHPEGLNGFILSAMVLRLLEEGIVSTTMSDDNAVRAVWVQLSRGYFTPTTSSGSSGLAIPVAEERGEVAVLRLQGEVMNVLFRSSATFFRQVVQRAAEEALQCARAADVFNQTAFQPLQLRHDVALTIHTQSLTRRAGGRHAESSDDDDDGGDGAAAGDETCTDNVDRSVAVKRVTTTTPSRAEAVQVVQRTLDTALRNRASYLTVWCTAPGVMQVAVQLSSEADGRNRLTRGPPIEEADAVAAFNEFWGSSITSTRQYPDGAIYRCVLWSFPEDVGAHTTLALSASTVTRRVVEYALRKHVDAQAVVSVLLGGLEGFLVERVGAEWRDAALLMQKSLMDAVKAVQKMLADLPRTALPCKITGFDVISQSERMTEVFPVRPHLALTNTTDNLNSDAFIGLSTAPTIEPIHCVLTIDDNHKIPDTMDAIAVMRGAICAQLAKYIQSHHGGGGAAGAKKADPASSNAKVVSFCTSHSVDIIHSGFLFRIYVAHYREVSLLRALKKDREADVLEQKLFWSVQHAKFLRTIAYGHPSYSNAVRLAKRWVSAMMLYEFVLPETVELLVANAYLGSSGVPKTAASGFLRFVQLLATYDWSAPLVLPFSDDSPEAAAAASLVRKLQDQQALFIATPYAPTESPFTAITPRPMVMHRLVQLAKGVVQLLLRHLECHGECDASADDGDNAALERSARSIAAVESAVFRSNPDAFDFGMALHPQLILQPDRALQPPHVLPTQQHQQPAYASTTLSMVGGGAGGTATGDAAAMMSASTAALRIWQLDELDGPSSREYVTQLAEREPAAHAVRTVRAALQNQGMVFYDAVAPRMIYVVGVTAQPVPKLSQQMHETILRVSRGALLPAPASAFKTSTESRSHSAAKAATTTVTKPHSHSHRPSPPTKASNAPHKHGAGGGAQSGVHKDKKRGRTDGQAPVATKAPAAKQAKHESPSDRRKQKVKK